MSDSYLVLWLEAPLQSWGHDSKFGRRDSLDFPTKSGVLGLICCALGAGGTQRDWLKRWANVPMQVLAFVRADHQGNPLPRLPLLRDFHMVGSGYDPKNPWQKLMMPKTFEGKNPVGKGTKLTYRYYVQDMAYAVLLQAPAAESEGVAEALTNPVWDLYLGRKNCVPTELIYQTTLTDEQQALEQIHQIAKNKQRALAFNVLEGQHEGELLTLNDVPVQFGPHKLYRDRQVTVVYEYAFTEQTEALGSG